MARPRTALRSIHLPAPIRAALVGIALTGSVVSACTLAACASAPAAQHEKAKLSYVKLFETGQYAAAFDASTKVAEKSAGMQQSEAALVAGLSAQALNRNAEAVRWLKPLTSSTDAAICGKANAALGLIAQERSEHQEAANNLLIAGEKLQGDESALAFMYAGDSLHALGQKDNATKAYTRAQERVATDSGLRIMIGDRLRGAVPSTTARNAVPSSATLTVQVGAWTDLNTAQRQAQKVANKAQVRIVPILKDGRRLYAVRVGKFSSREAAEQIKALIGGTAVVTAASGE